MDNRRAAEARQTCGPGALLPRDNALEVRDRAREWRKLLGSVREKHGDHRTDKGELIVGFVQLPVAGEFYDMSEARRGIGTAENGKCRRDKVAVSGPDPFALGGRGQFVPSSWTVMGHDINGNGTDQAAVCRECHELRSTFKADPGAGQAAVRTVLIGTGGQDYAGQKDHRGSENNQEPGDCLAFGLG